MKTFRTFITESTISLYHGGRNLEQNYQETVAHKKGNWEYGPGLYLTTHYDTAYKYAKGGGKVFKVTVEEGQEADDVRLTREVIEQFAKRYVIGRKRQIVADAVNRNINRLKSDTISANTFINIIVNEGAIKNTDSGKFKDFLAQNGVDYIINTRYGGRDETVLVVVNPKKIKKVEVVSPNTKEFELPFKFN